MGPQIWIPETEYYQKVSSHAQIGPQGAEKSCCGWWSFVVCVSGLVKSMTALSSKIIHNIGNLIIAQILRLLI